MKRMMTRALMITTLFTLAFAATSLAEASKEERALDQEATRLGNAAGAPDGERTVVGKMEKEFSVSQERIQALRDKKLGYGEIAVAFSLARKMPGGITDENVSTIMAMRQGPPVMGWGKIAMELGTKLGPAVSQMRSMNKETAHEMKQSSERRQDRMSGAGQGDMRRGQERDQRRDATGGGKHR